MLWVSDSWLPEWADAGWIAPVNQFPELLKYNADADQFCTDSMTYKGKQYGLTYYSDYMAFFYDAEMLKKAGIKEPPKTWDEVLQQSLKIKSAGLSEYLMMLSMARRELADRVPLRHGVLARRPLRGRQGRRGHPAGQRRRAARAAVGRRRRAEAQDHLPACVETGELNGLKAFGAGNHAFALLSRYRIRTLNDQAVAHRRPRAAGADARRPRRLQRHRRLDALPRHDAAGRRRQDPRRQRRQADRVVRRQGRQPVPVPEDAVQRPGLRLRHSVDVQGSRGAGQLRQVRGHQVFEAQQKLARKKDVIARWFGEWDEVNGTAWQSAVIGKSTVAAALKKSADSWNDLRKET